MSKKRFRYNGVLNVNKPTAMTSHDVVDRVREITRMRKIGHTGTLDPMATGVLPLCLGHATKVAQFLLAVDKEYVVEMILGKTTTTQDTTGELIEERPVPEISLEELDRLLDGFRGEIDQIPPMVSAKKYKGERLYKMAREGREIEREPCRVTLYELELQKLELPIIRFRMVCSKGTYVRTVCHDIGEAIGCGAAMCGLIRTRCGTFRIEDAIPLEDLEKQNSLERHLASLDEALAIYPALRVAEREAAEVGHGMAVTGSGILNRTGPFEAGSLVRIQNRDGELIAIAKALLCSEKIETIGSNLKTIQPVKVFH